MGGQYKPLLHQTIYILVPEPVVISNDVFRSDLRCFPYNTSHKTYGFTSV